MHLTREEANEEVKLKAIAALGCWLSRMSQWNASVLDRIAAGLKEKDILRRCHLQALNKVNCFPPPNLQSFLYLQTRVELEAKAILFICTTRIIDTNKQVLSCTEA